MTRPPLAPPAPRRRGGALALALLLATWSVGQADPVSAGRAAPTPCGTLDGLGFVAEGALVRGDLRATWTLVAAPVDAPVLRPLVFVDGVLRTDFGPVAFPCDRAVSVDAPDLGAHDAVHWLLHGWPPVPSALTPLGFEEARLAYAARLPPGTFALADVGFDRPLGGRPRAIEATATGAAGALVEDRVEVPAWALPTDGRDGRGGGDRLVRAPVGALLPIRIVYAAPDAARVLATCLLDGAQAPVFAGASALAAQLEPGGLLVLDGAVRVPGPGWHRLHCLLLPDDADPTTPAPPRPLLALYVWGAAPR
ncbi:MAG: hypothetical protein ABR510_07845 [Trueperaceae bacterium]